MKVTATWVHTKIPWLSAMLNNAEITGRKVINFCVKTTHVDTTLPALDCMVRHSVAGRIATMENSQELEAVVSGNSVNPGFFYAQLDISEYYNIRKLTVWLNQEDFDKCTLEIQNKAMCI